MPIVLRGAQAEEDLIEIWSRIAMEIPLLPTGCLIG
jgi:hypothetical protein